MKNNKELAVHISLIRVFLFFLVNIWSPVNADQPFCSYKEISDALSAPLKRELHHWLTYPSTRSSDLDNHFCTYNLWETIEKNVDSIRETDSARLNTAGGIFLCQYYRSLISSNSNNPDYSEYSILISFISGFELKDWIGYRPTVLSVQEEREYIFDIVIFLLGKYSYRKDPLKHKELINLMNLQNSERLSASGSNCLHFLELMANQQIPYYLYSLLLLYSTVRYLVSLRNEGLPFTAITFFAVFYRLVNWRFEYNFLRVDIAS